MSFVAVPRLSLMCLFDVVMSLKQGRREGFERVGGRPESLWEEGRTLK